MAINTTKILSRKGVGNEPFVFRAQGIASLNNNRETEPDDPKIDVSVDQWNEREALDKFHGWFSGIEPHDDFAESVGDVTVRPHPQSPTYPVALTPS